MNSEKLKTLMETQAAGSDRLESLVYKQLLDQIRFGTLALGQKLPSENELSEEHGVSRPVVRAALSKLRDSGLIISRRGAGSFVNSGVETIQKGYSPLNSISDISDFFRFRRTIEAETAELAVRKGVNAEDLQTLRDLAQEVQDLIKRGEESVQTDIWFHTTLAQLSDSSFLLETIELLRPHWIFVGNFVRSLGMARVRTGKRMTDEHFAIVDAVAAGDPARAREAMLRHVDGSENRVFKGE